MGKKFEKNLFCFFQKSSTYLLNDFFLYKNTQTHWENMTIYIYIHTHTHTQRHPHYIYINIYIYIYIYVYLTCTNLMRICDKSKDIH